MKRLLVPDVAGAGASARVGRSASSVDPSRRTQRIDGRNGPTGRSDEGLSKKLSYAVNVEQALRWAAGEDCWNEL